MEILWALYNLLAVVYFSGVVLFVLSKLLKIVYVYFVSKFLFAEKNFRQCYGNWAVVTGGSDGIGKNYARELARRKINLVLISNVEEDLIAVSNEIEQTFGVETRVIVADFSHGEEEYQRIFAQIEDLNIGILINNVGISLGLPNRFERISRKHIWALMMVNSSAAVSMAHKLLPKMKSNKKGLIVNISSASSLMPTPYANLYGASKIFIRRFSEALRIECSGSGVEVQTLCPCFVDTKICAESNAGMQVGLLFPSPETFAASAIATVGITSLATGYWPHELQYLATELAPTWLTLKIATSLMTANKGRDEPKRK